MEEGKLYNFPQNEEIDYSINNQSVSVAEAVVDVSINNQSVSDAEAVVGDYNDAKIAAAYASNSTAKAIATSVASNALGEGLEEVSEELWFDIAKGLYNGAAELGLTSTGRTM